jgi:peptidoglycan/LPS O-acetylase OafA/YrhL
MDGSRRIDAPPPPSPAPELPGHGRRLLALDGLRGIAVLGVLLFHVFQLEPVPGHRITRLAVSSTRVGQTGVDLFFVLSGFLITRILFDAKSDPRYFRNFYARRILRIFPLYYGFLAVAFLLMPLCLGGLIDGPGFARYRAARANQVWLWFYGANFAEASGVDLRWIGHFWTLAVEEHFYLVWPLMVAAMGRKALMRLCPGLLAGAVLLRWAILSLPHGLNCNHLTPLQADGLVVGAWLALAARGPRGLAIRPGQLVVVLVSYAACVAALYVRTSGEGHLVIQTIKPLLLALLYGQVLLLAILARRDSLAGRFFTLGSLRYLGQYSYAFYVFHPFAILVVRWYYPALGLEAVIPAFAGSLLKLGMVLVLTMIGARASWVLYESRFLKWKEAFAYGPVAESVRAVGPHREAVTRESSTT